MHLSMLILREGGSSGQGGDFDYVLYPLEGIKGKLWFDELAPVGVPVNSKAQELVFISYYFNTILDNSLCESPHGGEFDYIFLPKGEEIW